MSYGKLSELDTLRLRVAALDELTDTLERALRYQQDLRILAEIRARQAERRMMIIACEAECDRHAERWRRAS